MEDLHLSALAYQTFNQGKNLGPAYFAINQTISKDTIKPPMDLVILVSANKPPNKTALARPNPITPRV